MPRAWRAEVAHGHLLRSRRLARSFERTAEPASGRLQVACVVAVLDALAPRPPLPGSCAHGPVVGSPGQLNRPGSHPDNSGALGVLTGPSLVAPSRGALGQDGQTQRAAGSRQRRRAQPAGGVQVRPRAELRAVPAAVHVRWARRFAYNHHIARVKDNLSARNAEKEAGTEAHQMTPSLSWAAVSFINELNAWKTGRLEYSPVAEDGAGASPGTTRSRPTCSSAPRSMLPPP